MTSLEQRKACVFGADRAGCPVIYIDTGRHVVAEVDWEETRRFVLFMVEHALSLAPERSGDWDGVGRQFSVVLDLSTFGLESLDLDVPLYLFQMLSYNYPGQMRALLVVSDSVLAWTLWNIVLPLMSEEAKSRIHWGLSHEDLQRFIHPTQLPALYGGGARDFPPPLERQLLVYQAQIAARTTTLPPPLQAYLRERKAATDALQARLEGGDVPPPTPQDDEEVDEEEEEDESAWGFLGSILG
jgi:hypothetical protein